MALLCNQSLGKWDACKKYYASLSKDSKVFLGLFVSFWLYIAVFATGYGTREVMPVVCALWLAGWYRYHWRGSTLQRFSGWWLFLFFFIVSIWGTLLSQNVWESFLHVARSCNKGFILPFIAMECVRRERHLRWLILAMVLAFFWQGLDGIWQSVTGYDFVDGTPVISGRLTGSLNDYRVGNYLALLLIPTAGVWYLLRERMSFARACASIAILLGPGLYMLYFTYTRNAYLTVIVAGLFWALIRGARVMRYALAGGMSLLLGIMYFLPHRFAYNVIAQDGRWELWNFALAIAEKFPIAGAGFGQFNSAFRALGLAPTVDPVSISHPHNIYLQLLCESGIVGLVLGLVFLFGILLWSYTRIKEPLRAEIVAAQRGLTNSCYWRITGLLWCAWAAYLVSGIAGHDFYRMWWQSLVMAHLGIMIGAVVNGIRIQRNYQSKLDSSRS